MSLLHDIVRQHGGSCYAGGAQAIVPGPGHSRKDRSLSLSLDGDRIVFHSWAGDSARDCMAYLGLEQARPQTAAEQAEAQRRRKARDHERLREEAANRAFCEMVWGESLPLAASPAESYLASRRLYADDCSEVRFHPECPRTKVRDRIAEVGTMPAMLGLVRNHDGRPSAIHCTYLQANGQRGKRLMFGDVRGGAVRLSPVGPERVLAVAEGIETAGSYTVLHDGTPTWALLSTAQYRNFQPPPGLRRLIIAVDMDDRSEAHPNGAGWDAACDMAERLQARCEVVVDPAPDGCDWNDCLAA